MPNYQFQIDELELNDGTTIVPPSLTVVLGPNNSGKSQLLKDILALCTTRTARLPGSTVLVKDLRLSLPADRIAIAAAYPQLKTVSIGGRFRAHSLSPNLTSSHMVDTGIEYPTDCRTQEILIESVGNALTAILTTEHRLLLAKEGPSTSHQHKSDNLLQELYRANSPSTLERTISDYVDQVFPGNRVALDFTDLQKLRIRVAESFDDCPADPREARMPMSAKRVLDTQGDGIRSFVGIVIALKTTNRPLILVDEPEAFLHPPQAFEIGRFIASEVRNGRQIIVSTHSTDVLRGISSVTDSANIIRIDRIENSNRFRHLPTQKLKEISLDPLLSSARVLDGLFYSAAVVTEADSDARFFHSASAKVRESLDVHFVNAANKQTVPKIMNLYDAMGVRRAGIVDFDVLRVADEWQSTINVLSFTSGEASELMAIRVEIASEVERLPASERIHLLLRGTDEIRGSLSAVVTQLGEVGEDRTRDETMLNQIERRLNELARATRAWNKVKEYGREALPSALQLRFDRLSQICCTKGLFIVPTGQLESMLVDYGIQRTTNKREWIGRALALVRGLEVDISKQPWKIISEIHKYLSA